MRATVSRVRIPLPPPVLSFLAIDIAFANFPWSTKSKPVVPLRGMAHTRSISLSTRLSPPPEQYLPHLVFSLNSESDFYTALLPAA